MLHTTYSTASLGCSPCSPEYDLWYRVARWCVLLGYRYSPFSSQTKL